MLYDCYCHIFNLLSVLVGEERGRDGLPLLVVGAREIS